MDKDVRIKELEDALRRIWHVAQHAPVASKAEQTVCTIQTIVRRVVPDAGK
jgi:hypothetical protein